VTDSSQGNPPPHNPYGGQGSSGENPYGQPPASDSPTQPYGQPSQAQPSQPQPSGEPAANPYGAPPATNPYASGQEQQAQPYGHYSSPYGGQQAGPLGDGLDMYGRPLTRSASDGRPGTVTAAGWITLVMSGLTGLLYGFITLAMIVAKDDVLEAIDDELAKQGATGDFDAESAFGIVLVVLAIMTIWCIIACVLAVFTMRRSKVARVLLIISSVVAALLSLVAIGSGISVVWLAGCVLVVIFLFVGGASQWFRDRY
jgi:hypothetical protein